VSIINLSESFENGELTLSDRSWLNKPDVHARPNIYTLQRIGSICFKQLVLNTGISPIDFLLFVNKLENFVVVVVFFFLFYSEKPDK
jgi:hypothetical protein